MGVLTDEQKAELQKAIPPEHIKAVQGNRYIEAWYAQQRANEIFGVDGWSYTSKSQLVAQEDNIDKKTGEVTGRKAAYVAQVALTIGHGPDAIVREDAGYCVGYGPDDCEAGGMASKGAVSDGLKRALKSLGNAFGLYLYDKSGKSPQASQREPTQRQQAPQPQNGNGKAELIDPKREMTGEGRHRFVKAVQDAYDDLGDVPVNEILAKHNVRGAAQVVYAATAAAIAEDLKQLRAGLMAGAPMN